MEDFSAEIKALLARDDVAALSALPDLFIYTEDGDSLLFEAVRQNGTNCAQFLMQDERMRAKLNVQAETPLMTAVTFERFTLIPVFLCYLGMYDENGVTALMRAIQYGYSPVFECLLQEYGKRDADGITALMLAAQDGLIEWFPLLVSEAGMRDNDGLRAIDIAKLRGVEYSIAALSELEK